MFCWISIDRGDGGPQLVERILGRQRDQLLADDLADAVQAEREIHLREAACAADHGVGDADGRDEDAARRIVEQLGGEQGGDRFVERLLVVKRLAHAHEDDVPHDAVFGCEPFAGEHDLVENLGGGEISAMPIWPVAQKPHAAAQPTCDDTQSDTRPVPVRMMTDSIKQPAAVRSTSFVAPSTCESNACSTVSG